MHITISDEKTLSTIKSEFSAHFPHLKLQFFLKGHQPHEGSAKALEISDDLTISQARNRHTKGELSIHANQKTSTLETEFESHYGLHVQVLRKSGTIWLQTTSTDSWTLAEQEAHGLADEKPIKK
jgi:hypothetical protein